ncbi:MAG: hypothetical protein WCT40_02200 [Candidatus Magasanikbacteria bacterium]|jgi:hypothetical protein
MTLILAKISQKMKNTSLHLVTILAIISQILMPSMVSADETADNTENTANLTVLTVSKSPIGHLVYPELDYPKPDKLVKAVLTAYSSTVDQCDDDPFIAAWGDRVYDGMIAANWLPRGTKVKIPSLFGDKIFTVADRMNARYGYGRIDIWMSGPRAEVNKFGVQRAEVEIYYPDNDFAVEHARQMKLAVK